MSDLTLQDKLAYIANTGTVHITASACLKGGIRLECHDPVAMDDWLDKSIRVIKESDVPEGMTKLALSTAPGVPKKLKFDGPTIDDVIDRAYAVMIAGDNSNAQG